MYPNEGVEQVKTLFSQGKIQEAINLNLSLLNTYPMYFELYCSLATILRESKMYKDAINILSKVITFGSLSQKETEWIQTNLIDNIMDNGVDTHITYPTDIIEKIKNRKSKDNKLITLTITSCKRFSLFEQTINSFINTCQDVMLIDEWLCVDDNSSNSDRDKMKELYPFITFVFKEYSQKGHPKSMNIIRDSIKTPYFFHLEDDWKFTQVKPYLTMCMDVITRNEKYGQCLINKNYSEMLNDIKTIVGGEFKYTPLGTRYYEHIFANTNEEKIEFSKRFGNGPNSSYWAHFSLRCGLNKTSILHSIGSFNENVGHFEMEYANRYYNVGYRTVFLDSVYAIHIGRLTSERFDKTKLNAYQLNNEEQFSKSIIDPYPKIGPISNENKTYQSNMFKPPPPQLPKPYLPEMTESTGPSGNIPPIKKTGYKTTCIVVNLDSRPEKYENFIKQIPKKEDGSPLLNFVRFQAIDGNKLKKNVDLCRLFEKNDYNMRAGMVGCALSHIKILTELVNTETDIDFLSVFEDDAKFTPNFWGKFQVLISNLPSFDIIYLGHHPKIIFKEENGLRLVKKTPFESLQYSFGGAFGYLITKSGATKILNHINSHTMTNCIDTIFQIANINQFYCEPPLITSEMNPPESDIQHNFNSLTMTYDEILREENIRYKNIDFTNDIDEAKTLLNEPTFSFVISLKNENDIFPFLKKGAILYRLKNDNFMITNSKESRIKDVIPFVDNKFIINHVIRF